jgi:hypothetical protein
VDDAEVMNELKSHAALNSASFQIGDDAIETSGMFALHNLAERAFQLARSMPSRPLDEYRAKIAKLPSTTEVERSVKQRVGQDVFRSALDDYWQGKCAATGISDRALLRASHIVPWAECASDEERPPTGALCSAKAIINPSGRAVLRLHFESLKSPSQRSAKIRSSIVAGIQFRPTKIIRSVRVRNVHQRILGNFKRTNRGETIRSGARPEQSFEHFLVRSTTRRLPLSFVRRSRYRSRRPICTA